MSRSQSNRGRIPGLLTVLYEGRVDVDVLHTNMVRDYHIRGIRRQWVPPE
jgi:hypothetical protein